MQRPGRRWEWLTVWLDQGSRHRPGPPERQMNARFPGYSCRLRNRGACVRRAVSFGPTRSKENAMNVKSTLLAAASVLSIAAPAAVHADPYDNGYYDQGRQGNGAEWRGRDHWRDR